jgi:hypothetical protein
MEEITPRKEYLLKLEESLYHKVLIIQRRLEKQEENKISFNETIHRLLKKALGKD